MTSRPLKNAHMMVTAGEGWIGFEHCPESRAPLTASICGRAEMQAIAPWASCVGKSENVAACLLPPG